LGAKRASLVKWSITVGRTAARYQDSSSPMINIFRLKEWMYLSVHNYGDEDQNDLMNLIDSYKGEAQMDNKIQQLMSEVETYKQAIQDAKDALASAEMELDETLDEEYNRQ